MRHEIIRETTVGDLGDVSPVRLVLRLGLLAGVPGAAGEDPSAAGEAAWATPGAAGPRDERRGRLQGCANV